MLCKEVKLGHSEISLETSVRFDLFECTTTLGGNNYSDFWNDIFQLSSFILWNLVIRVQWVEKYRNSENWSSFVITSECVKNISRVGRSQAFVVLGQWCEQNYTQYGVNIAEVSVHCTVRVSCMYQPRSQFRFPLASRQEMQTLQDSCLKEFKDFLSELTPLTL